MRTLPIVFYAALLLRFGLWGNTVLRFQHYETPFSGPAQEPTSAAFDSEHSFLQTAVSLNGPPRLYLSGRKRRWIRRTDRRG